MFAIVIHLPFRNSISLVACKCKRNQKQSHDGDDNNEDGLFEYDSAKHAASDAEITAVITSSDGSSHTVHLNKSNNYTESVTLPRVAHGVAVTHTVSYTSSGTNVIQNDVSGLEEFGGDVSQIHVTGKMRKVVAPNKMNLVIDATGVISNDRNPWAVRPDASGTIHTSDWQKQKSFTPRKRRIII